jgi:peptidyl-tRNA hydrolase, PTH1 family
VWPFGTRKKEVEPGPEKHLCLIGLGNPGRKYRNNRHNIGFRVAERFAERLGISSWHATRLFEYGLCAIDDREIMICKPGTYMNRSGDAVSVLVHELRWEPERFLIVYDDVSIPLGSLRVRAQGTSGGHNGLQSIIDCVQTRQIPRLRFGVGPAEQDEDLADFVLNDFAETQEDTVVDAVERSCDAVSHCIVHGIERTMNVFNSVTTTIQEQ